ncbi:hypothetical protein QAD02_020402 [Eretmocerus hayati]|uniref:Uncharacterized protein n=1 Tax=Eretmocerus hayati TaxID=131215 RepID=A0ACC2PM06_9HYME|nr:hypothetical protein QAD02_020402 [Eretmocerus hayati]
MYPSSQSNAAPGLGLNLNYGRTYEETTNDSSCWDQRTWDNRPSLNLTVTPQQHHGNSIVAHPIQQLQLSSSNTFTPLNNIQRQRQNSIFEHPIQQLQLSSSNTLTPLSHAQQQHDNSIIQRSTEQIQLSKNSDTATTPLINAHNSVGLTASQNSRIFLESTQPAQYAKNQGGCLLILIELRQPNAVIDDEFKVKWRAKSSELTLIFKSSPLSKIYGDFPCLSRDNGFELLTLIYDDSNETSCNNFISNWPQVSENLIAIANYKQNLALQGVSACLKEAESLTGDPRQILALKLLPLLIGSYALGSSKSQTKKPWKPDAVVIQQSFILHEQTWEELETKWAQLVTKFVEKGQSLNFCVGIIYQRGIHIRSEECCYDHPEEFKIGERLSSINDPVSGPMTISKDIHAVHISLPHTLKTILEMPGVYESMRNRKAQLLAENTNTISNIVQGKLRKEKYAPLDDDGELYPILITIDGAEPGNTLGSHAGNQKFGAVFASLPCLPPHLVAK